MDYFVKDGDKLKCLLCSHYCKLKDNQSGICAVNKNIGEKIECLVYAYPKAINIDPIEKKPLYHFLPNSKSLSIGTIGCNFKCPFCQNWSLSQEKEFKKDNYFSPKDIVNLALENECSSISYTYNEPTIFYPYIKDIAIEAKKYGLKNVFVSNGFESIEVIKDMEEIIDAINVDLKTFNKSYYKKLGGNLDKILDNLKLFHKSTIHLEITTLIIPTKNDSLEELSSMAEFISNELSVTLPWHLSAFHPDYKEQNLQRTSLESLNMAFDIAKKYGLKYVYIGNMGLKNITKCKNCNSDLILREYFEVTKMLLKDGLCPYCNTKVDGVFDE